MMLQRVHMWRNEIKTALEQLGEKTVKFSTGQFKIVRDLATLLHPYKLVVDELQGSKFPTIGQGYYCQFKLAALITGVNTNKVDVNKFGTEVKAVFVCLFYFRLLRPHQGQPECNCVQDSSRPDKSAMEFAYRWHYAGDYLRSSTEATGIYEQRLPQQIR